MGKNKPKEKKEEKKNKFNFIGKVVVAIELILSFLGLYYNMLIRSDTAELSKFTDKPVYYTISLYTNENTENAIINDKYLSIDLTLLVDAFEIKKNNFLDINYNAVFTKIKYFMVYDYSLKDHKYDYMRYTLDDKSMAKLRLEDDYYALPTKLNYSFTPNKEYIYLLIYTETTTEKNLDLIFAKYNDQGKTFTLDLAEEKDGKKEINIKRIDFDTFICKEYFIDLWSDSESTKSDLKFMFDVYNDLRDKIIL